MAPKDFFDKYAAAAINSQIKTGVPASITLAQAALESGWGKYAPGFNFFGIKDSANDNYHGASTTQDTVEYINGKRVVIKQAFRKYNNAEESFNDHGTFLVVNSRYKSLFSIEPTLYAQWAVGLQKAGYATDPGYSKKLIDLIESYNLNKYSEQALLKKK